VLPFERVTIGRSYAARLCSLRGYARDCWRDNKLPNLGPPPTWAEAWHLWTVLVQRRSINGRLVFGKVWRRHDGRHWIFKKFGEYTLDQDE
jgi:hypothetical protein